MGSAEDEAQRLALRETVAKHGWQMVGSDRRVVLEAAMQLGIGKEIAAALDVAQAERPQREIADVQARLDGLRERLEVLQRVDSPLVSLQDVIDAVRAVGRRVDELADRDRVATVTVGPNDHLIVGTSDPDMTRQDCIDMQRGIARRLGHDRVLVVYAPGMTLGVVSSDQVDSDDEEPEQQPALCPESAADEADRKPHDFDADGSGRCAWCGKPWLETLPDGSMTPGPMWDWREPPGPLTTFTVDNQPAPSTADTEPRAAFGFKLDDLEQPEHIRIDIEAKP